MQPLKILLVDDSAVIRRAITSMLSSDPEIVVVGSAGNGTQALERIPGLKPDLIILDIEMPGMVASKPSSKSGNSTASFR